MSLGDFDNALTSLEFAYKNHSLMMPSIKADPALEPLRNEPRFKELLKKLNL